jgi:hypothetical protein
VKANTLDSVKDASKILLDLDTQRKSAEPNEQAGILSIEKQLLQFMISGEAYFGNEHGVLQTIGKNGDFSLTRTEGIVLWIPLDEHSNSGATGGGNWSLQNFARFDPYWSLLADAASAGDIKTIRSLVLAARDFPIDLGVGDQCKLNVELKSGMIADLTRTDLDHSQLSNGRGEISIAWQKGRDSEQGKLINLSGKDCNFTMGAEHASSG